MEAALRRAEGLAGERERRARESAVKGKIKAQNRERVEKGLQPFYPKKSEVKQMLLKDKYDRLSGGGNERASGQEKKQLKKALERRRRKNAQKEKRDMPAGIGFARDGGAVPKRKRLEGVRASRVSGLGSSIVLLAADCINVTYPRHSIVISLDIVCVSLLWPIVMV